MKFNPGGLLQHQVINDGNAKGSEPVDDRVIGREDGFNLVSGKRINNGRHNYSRLRRIGEWFEVGRLLPFKRAGGVALE
jgi:hypothetical protein